MGYPKRDGIRRPGSTTCEFVATCAYCFDKQSISQCQQSDAGRSDAGGLLSRSLFYSDSQQLCCAKPHHNHRLQCRTTGRRTADAEEPADVGKQHLVLSTADDPCGAVIDVQLRSVGAVFLCFKWFHCPYAREPHLHCCTYQPSVSHNEHAAMGSLTNVVCCLCTQSAGSRRLSALRILLDRGGWGPCHSWPCVPSHCRRLVVGLPSIAIERSQQRGSSRQHGDAGTRVGSNKPRSMAKHSECRIDGIPVCALEQRRCLYDRR